MVFYLQFWKQMGFGQNWVHWKEDIYYLIDFPTLERLYLSMDPLWEKSVKRFEEWCPIACWERRK